MAFINKLINHSKGISLMCSKLESLNLINKCNLSSFNQISTKSLLTVPSNNICASIIKNGLPPQLIHNNRQLHSTPIRMDIMEFFDLKKNWGETEVKHGRAWTQDELRIKSNTDLHKLWFVLLKERNMLLTMEHEYINKMEMFPNPERLDKVKISMENLENVVRERNRAYYLLETGWDGERPGRVVYNQIGMRQFYRATEHVTPKHYNKKWKESHKFGFNGTAVRKFQRLMREKAYNTKRKAKNRDRNEVMHLLKRFPNLNRQLLATKYPTVDIEKLLRDDKCRGHFEPKV